MVSHFKLLSSIHKSYPHVFLNRTRVRFRHHVVRFRARWKNCPILLSYLKNYRSEGYNVCHRPLSRRLDRCDRVIHNESGDPNGGNMCSFSGATCTSSDVTMQITFLTRKSALIYRRDLRQRVASLTLNCNGVLAI